MMEHVKLPSSERVSSLSASSQVFSLAFVILVRLPRHGFLTVPHVYLLVLKRLSALAFYFKLGSSGPTNMPNKEPVGVLIQQSDKDVIHRLCLPHSAQGVGPLHAGFLDGIRNMASQLGAGARSTAGSPLFTDCPDPSWSTLRNEAIATPTGASIQENER